MYLAEVQQIQILLHLVLILLQQPDVRKTLKLAFLGRYNIITKSENTQYTFLSAFVRFYERTKTFLLVI